MATKDPRIDRVKGYASRGAKPRETSGLLRGIDACIVNAQPFAKPILKHLRKIVHAGCPGVMETIKWGMPHFVYGDGILCAMAAFKSHCVFGFWKGQLLFGRNQSSEDAMGHFGRITSIADLPSEKTLIGYVRKAAALNEKGIQVPDRKKKRKPLPAPSDLAEALKKNVKARKTFASFSPTNQRDYIEWITEAKRDETRSQRLKTAIEWMAEAKPRNWKYMRR